MFGWHVRTCVYLTVYIKDEYHFKIEEGKKNETSEKPNGGKSMIETNKRRKKTEYTHTHTKEHEMEHSRYRTSFQYDRINGGKQEKENIRTDKKKLHHITINLMSVEMLFRRQKYRQLQQQQILYKLTAKESEKEQKKNNMH